jgi:hypothetical protein
MMTGELRRPLKAGQWYSKTVTQWEALSLQQKKLYTHVGRIEETSEGEVDALTPCAKCATKEFVCMRYTKSAQADRHVLDQCSRCFPGHRACRPCDKEEEELWRKRNERFDTKGETPKRPLTT